MKWPCMRYVSTSTKTGPSPPRAKSSASCAASKTACTSCPSTLIDRMSYASARFDMSSHTGECCQPDGDGLLADRDVQEAGKVAGAKPLLDLLLEVPDEEHVAEELAQRLLGDRLFLLDLGHDRRQCTFCAVSLVGEWRALQAGLPDGWVQASLQLEVRDPEVLPRVAALLGPAAPYRSAPTILRFDTARDGRA